ncbi:SDR family NAD(P)-dependent oxidoreductase, partial [uncultured Spongiibacter sp.]
ERVHTVVADLADAAAIDAVAQAITASGRLDILVNNAGITHRSLAGHTDPAVFRKVMAIDWQAPVSLSMALLPLLRRSRGSIINIGSMAGWMPVLGRAAYCSAKSALSQFFEVLRGEEQDNGVHVLMVYPAFVNTNIEQNALGADGNAARHARSTLGGIGEPEPLAAAILQAAERRKPHLFPHRGIWLASLLWRVAPTTFHRLMRRKFAVELEQH